MSRDMIACPNCGEEWRRLDTMGAAYRALCGRLGGGCGYTWTVGPINRATGRIGEAREKLVDAPVNTAKPTAPPEQQAHTLSTTGGLSAELMSVVADSCPACDDDGGLCKLCGTRPAATPAPTSFTPEQPTLVLSDTELAEIRESWETSMRDGADFDFAELAIPRLLAHVATLQHQLDSLRTELEVSEKLGATFMQALVECDGQLDSRGKEG